jgi:hypothetical protein
MGSLAPRVSKNRCSAMLTESGYRPFQPRHIGRRCSGNAVWYARSASLSGLRPQAQAYRSCTWHKPRPQAERCCRNS